MDFNVSELEQRLSILQAQVERLWQKTERSDLPLEQRLAGMADQHAEYLKRWAATMERHTQAVTQLEAYIAEWKDARGRMEHESSQRLHDLEGVIAREWDALRNLHEQPIRELRDQAASLTEVCIATASAAQQGFDRAEARLATFEGDFHRRLSELSRELQSVVTELRARGDQARRLDTASQWSLDDVTRLHNQLRETSGANVVTLPASVARLEAPAGSRPGDAAVPEVPAVRTESGAPVGGPALLSSALAPVQPGASKWRVAVAVLGAIVLIAGVFGWRLQNEVRAAAARALQAEVDLQKAAAEAAEQTAAARNEAAREISMAREMADRAQRIGDVLAAPDLIRYNLSGGDVAPRAFGRALWSRSRGFVFSASRLPAAPPNQTHQLWLLTRAAAVSVGPITPDANGAVTLVQDAPPVPRAVVGVMVTTETAGTTAPTGDAVLTSVAPVAPTPPPVPPQ